MSTAGLVLIADDDRAIRTVLSQALARAGFQTRSTGTCSRCHDARWRLARHAAIDETAAS